ncbi:Beta-1,3-galactosyltransferase 5 [Thelohanellus kitauei]|uniref:Hexosyltransferase n=1 Tax=Thelohanellus kitauei TaxID=669202 RepID=A0A0C2JER1_THEKT|nr:Beta-1,3-galactosyltransferase 5 [Thelohanellus kitauei]
MLLKAAVFVVFLKLILWDLFLRCSSIDERLSITHDEFANSNELKFLAQNRLDLIGYEDKYINFSRLDDPLLIEHTKRILDKSCGEYVDVIIFMISSPDNTHLRESHRNVIGNQRIKSESRTLKNKYRHCFVYTVGYSGKEYLDEYVDTESLRFSDIIRIPLVESYYNLPKKVSTSLAVLNHFKDRFEYVLKTDDDTVIKTNILIPMIFSEFRKFDIVGYVKEAPCVIRHENDKFYMSKDDMSSDHFHSHPQGGGYIIRSSVVKGIILISSTTQHITNLKT